MSDETPPVADQMESSDSGAFGKLAPGGFEIKPIPDKKVAAEEQPTHEEPEQEQEEPDEVQPFRFAGREFKDQKAAERWAAGAAGTLKALQKREAEYRDTLEDMDAEMRALKAARRVAASDAPEAKPVNKAEWQDFVDRMSEQDWKQYDADMESHGEKVAVARLMNKAEGYYRDQIKGLRDEMADLKRTAIDEPAQSAEDVKEYSSTVQNLFVWAENFVNENGDSPFEFIYAAESDREVVQRLDEIHQVMLKNRMDPTPESFFTAAHAWRSYNQLYGTSGEGSAPVSKRGQQRRSDPTLGVDDGGSPPVRRQQRVDLIAGSSPRNDTAFGKLAR